MSVWRCEVVECVVHIVLESTNPRQALQLVRDRRAAR